MGEHPAAEPDRAASTLATVDWIALVLQIRTGEDVGLEHLYKLFSRGIRYYLLTAGN